MENSSIGKQGEDIACGYLQSLGYKLLEKNFHAGHKEVDLIFEADKYIIFVEVKTRTSPKVAAPESAVSREKQRSIIKVANSYMHRKSIDKDCRFDIVSIIIRGNQRIVKHIPNAFYALR